MTILLLGWLSEKTKVVRRLIEGRPVFFTNVEPLRELLRLRFCETVQLLIQHCRDYAGDLHFGPRDEAMREQQIALTAMLNISPLKN